MNAAAFLKLVDGHPLPWFHDLERYWQNDVLTLSGKQATDLADAAPAMAAAILRVLQKYGDLTDYDECFAAKAICDELRASLPESLRQ